MIEKLISCIAVKNEFESVLDSQIIFFVYSGKFSEN